MEVLRRGSEPFRLEFNWRQASGDIDKLSVPSLVTCWTVLPNIANGFLLSVTQIASPLGTILADLRRKISRACVLTGLDT
ncbi:hypothetical protein CU103_22260 [Phyllobacterium sophorae]|uniref:Uncharacterized protein n=1 Tax=Phyllobacterium sophorae TaxID=1520277 RepID=A0A2P7B4Z9_9HYPH|nr:hypothetical protein CU103_22260 [Phyllobacterium sophorae]